MSYVDTRIWTCDNCGITEQMGYGLPLGWEEILDLQVSLDLCEDCIFEYHAARQCLICGLEVENPVNIDGVCESCLEEGCKS